MSNGIEHILKIRSHLAHDLAISRVSTAALKLQAGHNVALKEQESAERLREYYVKKIKTMNRLEDITPSVVPMEAMREVLKKSLASSPVTRGEKIGSFKLFTTAVEILDKLNKQGTLDRAEAGELFVVLRKIESSEDI